MIGLCAPNEALNQRMYELLVISKADLPSLELFGPVVQKSGQRQVSYKTRASCDIDASLQSKYVEGAVVVRRVPARGFRLPPLLVIHITSVCCP
jgi:hypothetical protein